MLSNLLKVKVVMVLSIMVLFAWLPTAASAQSVEWKLGLFFGPRHPITQITKEISQDLEKITNGRVKVKVFDSGTLGTGPGTLDAIQKGVMDISYYIWTYATLKKLPFLMVGGLPYVYRDGAGYLDAWTQDATLMNMANAHASKNGYDNILFMEPCYSGFARIGFKDKAPKVPADLKGLKIRGTGSYIKIIESYGATPAAISTPEVYAALERGLIDGAMGLDANWLYWKWMEPATYLLDVNLAPVGGSITVNKSSWEKLSDQDKLLMQFYLRSIRTAINNRWLMLEISGNRLMENSMTIYRPTAEEQKLWNAPRGEIAQEWIKVVGEDGNKALTVIEKYNK